MSGLSEKLSQYKKEIIESYNNGISTNKLGEKFHCNAGSIYLFLKDCGVKLKSKKKFSGKIEDYENLILEEFNKGKSARSIGSTLGISKPAILRILHKNNCELKSVVDHANLLKDKKNIVISLYLNGKSTNEIATIVGHSQPQVWALLNKEGIDTSEWKYEVDETFFEKIDTEDKAYVLGWMYSDGNVTKEGKFRIGVQDIDKDIIHQISNILKYEGPIYDTKRGMSEICVNRKKMADDLIKLGCVPNKSLILDFPTFEQVPEHLLSHFVRGVFDGDGSISKNYANITSSDKFNFKLNQYLTNKLGIIGKIYFKNENKATCGLFFCNRHDREIFLDWLYKDSTISLKRKYQRYIKFKETIK